MFADYVPFCTTYELFRQADTLECGLYSYMFELVVCEQAHLCDVGIFFDGRVASGSRQSSCDSVVPFVKGRYT